MKIAFFDAKPYDVESFERAKGDRGIEFKYYDTKLNADTVSLAKGFYGVCAFVNDVIDATVIDRLHKLGISVLALRCSGFNHVDLKEAQGKLPILRVPAYSPYAVAEHTMALLLTLVRKTHKAYIRSRDFNFSINGLTGFDLHGKTVGLIGMGRIGKAFCSICRGFGMQVIAFDRYAQQKPIEGVRFVSLDALLKNSDIVSLHCPLTEETYHIIDADAIRHCKSGVIILNTSRGALLDAEALLEGIKAHRIGGAGLDVYEEESELFYEDHSNLIIEDDTLARLISMPNVIVTSHQAYLTKEALSNIAETTIHNFYEFYQTGACEHELIYRGKGGEGETPKA